MNANVRRRLTQAVVGLVVFVALTLLATRLWRDAWYYDISDFLVSDWFAPTATASISLIVLRMMWKVPKWQVDGLQGTTYGNRFEREYEARKTIAQVLGGLFLLVGLYSSGRTLALQTNALALQTASLAATKEGQITDRFTKAIEQLGATDSGGRPSRVMKSRVSSIHFVRWSNQKG
jgi:hypothetical protein